VGVVPRRARAAWKLAGAGYAGLEPSDVGAAGDEAAGGGTGTGAPGGGQGKSQREREEEEEEEAWARSQGIELPSSSSSASPSSSTAATGGSENKDEDAAGSSSVASGGGSAGGKRSYAGSEASMLALSKLRQDERLTGISDTLRATHGLAPMMSLWRKLSSKLLALQTHLRARERKNTRMMLTRGEVPAKYVQQVLVMKDNKVRMCTHAHPRSLAHPAPVRVAAAPLCTPLLSSAVAQRDFKSPSLSFL
jgi:hypothetical protein